jgi:hypothetical protein
VVTLMHLGIARDLGVAPQDVTEHRGIAPHVAQDEDVAAAADEDGRPTKQERDVLQEIENGVPSVRAPIPLP